MKTLSIDSLTYGPYGVGREGGKVILVPFTAPGDEVMVDRIESKGNYAKASLSQLLKASQLRQEPPCPYFAQCGGCPWQHLQYGTQLAAKAQNVADALGRIGKLEGFETLPIVPSSKPYHYRRRIRLQCVNGKSGFYRAFSHELVEVEACLIADARLDLYLGSAREWCRILATETAQIEIVSGDRDEVVFVGTAPGPFFPRDERTCKEFLEDHREIQGLILKGPKWRRLWGDGKISWEVEGLKIEADADSFAQVNREGNAWLVGELLRWGNFNSTDRILELYCGAGNFTLPVAQRVAQVVAVEANRLSAGGGKESAETRAIQNIRWLSLPVSRAVQNLRQEGETFSKIILNPPRSGAKAVIRDLSFLGAEKIFYISCDPATLARDLSALSQTGYSLVRVQPFDLFPQTFHVETLAEIIRTRPASARGL